ncbi:TfoX/Sxy family DNA transformation protein [Actinomadura rugatobispora]|uniref:TfoX/Sxy family DNA transformation protein n=1 Tax=Actinomadura rugatobispora TaxID=1994 RepID=A0ABW1A550_9ACTN|nr:hypothetical protein GCM10010200_088450 [Actinomadura rugatobispora]
MTRTGARQRPANARAAADGMKLHRRTVRLAGRAHTVIGLRPGTRARFSTNLFHGTWHLLSDRHGARTLARLLWGLAYQSRPGTLLVIDRPFLAPTPFEADPADPIVIVPDWHTPFGPPQARALSRALPLRGAPDGTVRWRTHGLDSALTDPRAWFRETFPYRHEDRGRVERVKGLIVLRPRGVDEMRGWAVHAGWLDPGGRFGTDYVYLGPWDHGHSGEIQVFRDFRRDVGVARRARARVLADPAAPEADDALRTRIWDRCGAIKRGRDLLIRNCRNLGPRAAERLAMIDVHTLDDLDRLGAAEAYRRLADLEAPGPSRTMLWAMEGALTDTHWRRIPPDRKAELLRDL